jgi:CubicO group peptidase (beta-lactamase class C family)
MLARFAFSTLGLFAAVSASAHAADIPTGLPADLPAYIDQVRTTFNVPGIAVAVIKDGKVVFEQGSGLRDVEHHLPVDVHTKFCIASNTKSVTATAIEMLAERGKLHMDDRVTDHLPWFRMAEPYATREMRVRDLLTHRSGLGPHAGDLLFLPSTRYSTREVVEHLGHLPLSTGFRESFAYENIMFAVATLIVEQASGQSYADFVRTQIFAPVGMGDALIDGSELRPTDDAATSYMPDAGGQLGAVPTLVWKNNAGAAGIYASIHDMARWAGTQLGEGELPSPNVTHSRLFSAATQADMFTMVTPIPVDTPSVPALAAAQPNSFGYAAGWFVSDFRGQRMVWHTGGFPGTVSETTLIPSLGLAVVVLTNQESEEAFNAITFHVADSYLGKSDTDWIAAFAASAKKRAERLNADDAKNGRRPEPLLQPALPLVRYAGRYQDAWYGTVEVTADGNRLRVRFSESSRLIGTAEPWQGDSFLIRWDDRTLHADAFVDFVPDGHGGISRATMRRASARTASAYDFQDLDLHRQ